MSEINLKVILTIPRSWWKNGIKILIVVSFSFLIFAQNVSCSKKCELKNIESCYRWFPKIWFVTGINFAFKIFIVQPINTRLLLHLCQGKLTIVNQDPFPTHSTSFQRESKKIDAALLSIRIKKKFMIIQWMKFHFHASAIVILFVKVKYFFRTEKKVIFLTKQGPFKFLIENRDLQISKN